MVEALFALTLFLSAALLFWVQLFTSKMVLPVLGGSAAVWNTCMVFFQVALLIGYLYAHLTNRYLSIRQKVFIHPACLLLFGLILPVSLHGMVPDPSSSPVIWLLKALFLNVGLPFIILAGTAPLLQAWYSNSRQRSSGDPYFLYAASNLGSLLALVSYPTFVEPNFHLSQQSLDWTLCYYVLAALILICAWTSMRPKFFPVAPRAAVFSPLSTATITVRQRFLWALLAFAPSSLLLGVTTHLTMDVASAPLFWVVPLFLYLLTFVLAFQRVIQISSRLVKFAQAFLLVCLAAVLLSDETDGVLSLFGLHLAAFFVTCLMCHQELARQRPQTKYLTEFYLLISLGGALGGIFNALIAPFLFNDIIEYPLVLVFACMLRPGRMPRLTKPIPAALDFVLPALLFAAIVALDSYTDFNVASLSESGSLIVVVFGSLLAFSFRKRSIRFALTIAALIASGSVISGNVDMLERTRNFYGVLKVVSEDDGETHSLYNGTTLHGSQNEAPSLRLEPLSYYHKEGPLGHLFAGLTAKETERVAVVGLGTGTVACYGKARQHWTFFEINPADITIANDPRFFTFLKDCPVHPNIVLGDARLSLAKETEKSFDMIILDAFTSDAIPIHLITRQAVELYLSRLKPGGLIVFHISNRYLDLGPVIGNIAASLNLKARRWDDEEDGDDKKGGTLHGKAASDWVVVAAEGATPSSVVNEKHWKMIEPSLTKGVWTDDYSNLLSAFVR